MWKYGKRIGQRLSKRLKGSLKKLQDENEEFKDSTTWLKSHDEELQDLRQKAKIWETTQRKWLEALFLHKQQKEALGSQVKALTKEKKEKENVMTNLELMNLKNVSMLQSKELRRKTIKAKREKLLEEKNEYKKNLQHLQAQLEISQEESRPNQCQEKIREL